MNLQSDSLRQHSRCSQTGHVAKGIHELTERFTETTPDLGNTDSELSIRHFLPKILE